ncbi:MAG: TetR-like C-terminal domain-containing protein [Ardenticatenaceae bacterium]|nr:TetR-like C-terminal domain-containing protein [Ardenticatenaceae bacterium]
MLQTAPSQNRSGCLLKAPDRAGRAAKRYSRPRAEIARKTFYAHYENKQQLLWVSLAAHFQKLEATTGDLNPDTLLMNQKPLSYTIFKHVEEYQLFYSSMLIDGEDSGFIFQFLDYLARQSYAKHQPLRDAAPMLSVPPEMIANFLSGALLGTLRWWLTSGLQETPEQMAYRFSQLAAPGVLQSMGLD